MPAYLNQFDEWPFIYTFQMPVLNQGDQAPQNPLAIQGDADFVWRGLNLDFSLDVSDFLGVFLPGQSVPTHKLRFFLPDSRSLSNAPAVYGWFGNEVAAAGGPQNNAASVLPMVPEVLCSKSSTLFLDVINFDVSALTGMLQVSLRGVKLVPKGSRFQIDRTRRYRAVPFTYWASLPALTPVGQTYLNNSVPLDSASQFLLLSIETAVQNFPFTFYGPAGEQMSNMLFSLPVVAGSAAMPGPICPPVAYPKAGQIVYDYRLPAAWSNPVGGAPVVIGFSGIKLYDV